MNERVIQFRVGVVVVAATIITGILVMLFGEGQALMKSQYTIFMKFPKAPGVTVDTPVRKHGILIGRVASVEMLDEGGVLLTARIDDGTKLWESEVCVIKTESLLGDAVLEFVPPDEQVASASLLQDGYLIADGMVAGNPLDILTNLEGNMATAIGSISSAANEVDLLARGLNSVLGTNDQQLQRILQKSEVALDDIHLAMGTVNDLVSDPELKESLKKTLQDMPLLFNEMRSTMTDARDTLAGFQRVSQQAETNLQHLERFTSPLGERGEEFVDNFGLIIRNVEDLTSQLVVFSQALNEGEGTLGRLIRDPELYDELSETVRSFNEASRRIRPILDNVRTFTDKVARDPRTLGVKGALDRKPLGMGLKSVPRTGLRRPAARVR